MPTQKSKQRSAFSASRLISCLLLYLLIQVQVFAAPPAAAPSPAASDITSLLDADQRLNRSVTIRATGISLEELLHKLKQKDLLLSAGRSCATQKLQIRLKQRSLRTLMKSLAELIPGTWVPLPDKSGYELDMSADTIAHRKQWWDLYLGEWERAKAALRASVLAQLRAKPVVRPLTDPNPRANDPVLAARDVAFQTFFNVLPATLQERIAEHLTDFALYTGYFTHGVDEGAVTVSFSDLPEPDQKLLRTRCEQWPEFNANPEAATVVFANVGLIQVSVSLPNGQTGDVVDLAVQASPDASPLPLDQRGLLAVVRRLGNAAPGAWKKLATYQESRVWPNDAPETPNRHTHPPRRSADILAWLGDQADMEFVADYYSHPCWVRKPNAPQPPLTRPLKQELDAFAVEEDCSWKQTDGPIYLIRNNRWYRDDFIEVPAPLLQRWQTQLLALHKRIEQSASADQPPLLENVKAQVDWEAEVASALTPWQIAFGLTWAAVEEEAAPDASGQATTASGPSPNQETRERTLFPYAAVGIEMLKELYTLRFYAGLSDAARMALLENKLPLASLPPAQQEQVASIRPIVREMRDRRLILLGLQSQHVSSYPGGPGAIPLDFEVHLIVTPMP